MRQIIYITTLIWAFLQVSCDNANELLDQHLKDGPIIYAGKINEMTVQSGFYRLRVNLLPADDVNRSYCKLSWNVTNEVKDSVVVAYKPENYDEALDCYYTVIPLPSIEGNLLIEAQNVDIFGNRSLVSTQGAFIYGETYVSTLRNSAVEISPVTNQVTFENRVGAVGNLVSYEQENGQFTQEVFVEEETYPLLNPKQGGIIRTKTGYLMSEEDIDILYPKDYLETTIP